MNKPNLIIIPGWGGNFQTWLEFSNLAERYFEVTCIELPCFGNEPCPDTVWGVEDYAEFVKEKIKGIEGEKILFGHSFGGQVATYLMAKNPKLVDKLVLSGAATFRPKKSCKRMIFCVVAKIGKVFFKLPILNRLDLVMKKVLYRLAKSPDYTHTSGTKKEIFKKIIRQDLEHLLPDIQVPTLVVWGEHDDYTPLEQGKRIAKIIPNASLEIIEKGRHGLHMHNREKLLEILKKV
ncbi:hypothetical protein C0581_02055 [Candidatus Parcubacteria bacterium]|nr:MAG: hypothetical protein C0581_02055 [Candidatus Parcubacteria bacterium]